MTLLCLGLVLSFQPPYREATRESRNNQHRRCAAITAQANGLGKGRSESGQGLKARSIHSTSCPTVPT